MLAANSFVLFGNSINLVLVVSSEGGQPREKGYYVTSLKKACFSFRKSSSDDSGTKSEGKGAQRGA